MIGLRQKLVAVALIGFVSAGVFAQKGKGGGRRPPKSETKVVFEPKREKPPQSKPQGDKRGGKRGRSE